MPAAADLDENDSTVGLALNYYRHRAEPDELT